eukprot:6986232-Pyramimonas_sp.AAC.1
MEGERRGSARHHDGPGSSHHGHGDDHDEATVTPASPAHSTQRRGSNAGRRRSSISNQLVRDTMATLRRVIIIISPVSSGYIVDSKGYIVDGKGYIVDGKGYIVDGKGYIADGKGYIVDGKGYIVDGKGYIVDGKGYMVDGKGYIVDGKGYIVDGKGRGWPMSY